MHNDLVYPTRSRIEGNGASALATYLSSLDDLDDLDELFLRDNRVSESPCSPARDVYDTSDMESILRQSMDDLQSTIDAFEEGRRQLHRSSVNYHGPSPPATEYTISCLPHARILPTDRKRFKDDKTPCGICCERLMDGVALIRLPCGHLFHVNCSVLSWILFIT